MEFLSEYLIDQIMGGKAILFLGAGASLGTESEDGKFKGLSGNGLRDLICDTFLSGKSKGRNLSYVGAVTKDLAGMTPVQELIKKHTNDLMPSEGHELITRFRWKAIATTNYDELVEKSYKANQNAPQTLKRVIGDNDDIQSILSDEKSVPLLKLHGCISRINDHNLPLILSSHDYHKYKLNRVSLFSTLKELAYSHTIVFCGYSISDENVRDLIFDVSAVTNERPKYILVDPSLEKQDIMYWASNRFECLPLTFVEFMKKLSEYLSFPSSVLGVLIPEKTTTISKFIASHDRPSDNLNQYIERELYHVHAGLTSESIEPHNFYRGNSRGFSWLMNDYDVPREIIDTILEDTVFDIQNSEKQKSLFFVVKGYAGSGKSVCLKRTAWEIGVTYNKPTFFLNDGAELRKELIFEISLLIKERIYVFIDDILDFGDKSLELIKESKKNNYPITFITSGRTNEWNSQGELFEQEVNSSFDLLDLNNNEVESLLSKLTRYNCLGYLGTLAVPERFSYLKSKLNNQLLVALHEATEGKTFEEIIIDEYDNIYPLEAKVAYLNVCSLHRFDIGVRAGLLSRIEGVNFNEFYKSLMAPLENIVNVTYDYKVGDYVYKSRHQHIANIVFSKTLPTAEEKSQQIIKIIRYLNVSYDTDNHAISQMIKGRVLAEEFTNKSLVNSIFNVAEDAGIHPSVINHQRAVFELHHPGGDLRAALGYINKAEQEPGTILKRTLQHTKSNIYRRLALSSNIDGEKRKLRQDALSILNRSLPGTRDSLPYFTKGQILFEEIKERMEFINDNDNDNEVINELTKQMESNLEKGLQLFPSDDKLLMLESDYSNFIKDSPRALKALEHSFRKNKDSIYTAVRLARSYYAISREADAISLLRKTVSNHPINKTIHFEIAKLLIDLNEFDNREEILTHLKRSFSTGDTHYEARYTYARHEYLYGDIAKSKREFSELAKIPYSPTVLNKVRGEMKDSQGNKITYHGTVSSVHGSFCFIHCIDFPENIYVHYSALADSSKWPSIRPGTKISCFIGFSFKGIAGSTMAII
ncbi:SIR2 family NAD-dependent protein deacylase [Klebsiella quasipneumoniae]|uniref:SIR2 family NAD-dependent protein deacylase n=1 Tax=Klebsiella quasipneumoniae TaxID=1463165 RepID=UPI0015A74D78|nr:SIR2 family protein [Klebsiella quasipneumoniae]